MSGPMPYRWTGEAFQPMRGFARRCDSQFVVGEVYRLERVEDRSAVSHKHYFASIAEAWANLPEREAERFANPEMLRKWALIQAGYADSRQIVAASRAEAQRLAAFVRPMDEYAVVTVREAVVTVYTAQSQSVKAMGKAAFQDSKNKVLDILAGLIGVTPAVLDRNAGQAA